MRPTCLLRSRLVLSLLLGLATSCASSDSCPDQVLEEDHACCENTRACTTWSAQGGYAHTTAEVALAALCEPDRCPASLDEALANASCSSAFEGCGLVVVHSDSISLVDFVLVYDASSGALVGASASTFEFYTRQIDGCCAQAFVAGVRFECAASTPRACTTP